MNRELLSSIAAAALLALGTALLAGCRSAPDPVAKGTPATPASPVALTANTGAGGSDAGAVAATVAVAGMRFQPDVVRIKAGQAVAWEFNDPGVVHSVTAFDRSFDSGLRADGAYVLRFDTPGRYCYQCLPHPGRNLCEQGARPLTRPPLLAGSSIHLGDPLLALLGGGGRMQGMIIVEH
jgi:plastocyanin